MRHRIPRTAVLLALPILLQCHQPGPVASVVFVVYDAGETLGLLPVAGRLKEEGADVRWFPLTPWAADLLRGNGEAFLELPDHVSELPHLEDRRARSEIGYWGVLLARDPPSLTVLGMVSTAQGQLASRLREMGIPTIGFYDGFQPPIPGTIGIETASRFDEIWVSTARVREGFEGLGFEAVVAGQPTLETWRRASEQVDPADIRRLQGLRDSHRTIVFAGQYGAGYEEVLVSFLGAMQGTLAADTSLHLVLSHHPRVDGSLERSALEQAGLPRAGMAEEDLPTSELATIADAVVTWTSTVAVQAAFMGKPVVYYSPPDDFDTYLVESGGARLADETSLRGILAEVLREPANEAALRTALVESGYVVDADVVIAEMIMKALGRGG
jgi:hypothetical protein